MPDPAVAATRMAPASPFLMRTRVKAMLYVLVLLSVALFSVTEQDMTPLILALIAAGAAWLIVDSPRRSASAAQTQPEPPQTFMARLFRRQGRGAPTFVLNLIVLAGAVFLFIELFDAWGNRSVIAALSHFIILLIVCKLFEEKTMRDIVQLLILSLLVGVSSAMFSNSSLLFAGVLAIYVGLLAYGSLLLHLAIESQTIAQKRVPAALPDPSHMARVRTDLRFAARNCTFLVLPLALIVFLLLPRSRGTGFATPWNVGLYETGPSDTVKFHDFGTLVPSDAVALRVKFSRNDGDFLPDINDLYFRGQVLTEYIPRSENGLREARWQQGSDAAPDSQPTGANGIPLEKSNWLNDTREEYTIEMSSRTRFVQGPIDAVFKAADASPSPNFVYSPHEMTLHDGGTGIDTRKYVVYSPPRQEWPDWENRNDGNEPAFIKPGVLRPERSDDNHLFREVLVSPEITAMARDLAKDYLPAAGQPIPYDSIRLIMSVYENYLRTHYPYSLTFRQVDPAWNPTTDFLLNRKTIGGHCEYFASAMVMLCRAVGLNARMVTGFHGGEFNVLDSSYTLRQRDAHAWAEVYVPGEGWVRSDPSPIQSNPSDSADYSVWRWGREFGQMLQNYWLSLVVSFDNDSRSAVGARIAGVMQNMGGFFHDLVTISSGSDLALHLPVFGALLGLAIMSGWGIRRWRADRRKLRDARGSPWRAIVALSGGIWFLDEMFSILERHGPSRRMDQTPREYVEEFIGRLGGAGVDARWLIELGYEVRFGALELDGSLRGKVSASLKHVRMAMSGKQV